MSVQYPATLNPEKTFTNPCEMLFTVANFNARKAVTILAR